MKVEFTVEEVQAMVFHVLDQIGDLDGFTRGDKTALKRWRSEELRAGSPDMQLLAEKVNADLQRIHDSAHVSAIQKPDWL
jgi:hypothetical protein